MKSSISMFSLFLLSIQLTSQVIPDQSTLMARAPATFQAVFHTSKGDFTVEAIREWSPAGADRLFQLLMTGFYNQNILFRVQKGYVIQYQQPHDAAFHQHVGILSDTHGYIHPRIPEFFSAVDEIWHAGDMGDIRK
ncbi:MAG: peptidylprolyl isomerase [Bacteroidetes bacterium]|nr:peptidylprolyl isomerase [Bacteroidota bacterium]